MVQLHVRIINDVVVHLISIINFAFKNIHNFIVRSKHILLYEDLEVQRMDLCFSNQAIGQSTMF